MENYPSNSNKSKVEPQEETNKVQPVVANPVTVKKKTKMQKFTDVFIKEDLTNVISCGWNEIVVPTLKRMIFDTFTDGLDMMLNGNDSRRYRASRTGGSSRYAYDKVYSRSAYQSAPQRTPIRANSGLEFDNILFSDRGDAERVLMELEDLIASEYRIASVQDYYIAAGLSCPYTYNNWGWDDLRAADVIRARDADGYYIKLPKPQPINK